MDRALDTLIVGGGPAGLSAALVLGRCLRNVLLCDTGAQRNRASRHIHAMPGQEGRAPSDFLDDVRQELCGYATIRQLSTEVECISPNDGDFDFRCTDGTTGTAATLLFATGLVDTLPVISNIETFYGSSIHHCVYCDGAEYKDQPLVAYGIGDKGATLALMLSHWSSDVVACCEETAPSAEWKRRLADRRIPIITSRAAELVGEGSALKAVIFENGTRRACSGLFFSTGCTQGSKLIDQLGCSRNERGAIVTDPLTEETSVPGVYVAGDASRDVLLVAVAVGEGAKAGVAINRALLKADGFL